MKFKRSGRLVDMTAILLAKPNEKFTMNVFQERYKAAKSSISEDVSILNEVFQLQGLGRVETYSGASGGVVYHPHISWDLQERFILDIIKGIEEGDRVLPGGYIYLTDILGDPDLLKRMGKIIASQVADKHIDYVMTVATKGIPLAQAVAYEAGCQFVIAHKDSKVTEGTTISVKYTSESSPNRVQRMEVVSNRIEAGANVVLVDDFYRGGGTMNGLSKLVDNFGANVVDKFVLCENHTEDQRETDVKSLIKIRDLESASREFSATPGSLFQD